MKRHDRNSSMQPGNGRPRGQKHASLVRRIFLEPVASKVPEIIFLFWVVKILTTAGGEATSDYFKTWGNIGGGGAEVALFVIGLRDAVRHSPVPGVRLLVLGLLPSPSSAPACRTSSISTSGIPYAGTTLLWAVVLAAIFWMWYRSEGTLSIHSITTQRREAFYWATVFATFALGTALGDFTATSLGLGYLASGILFGVVILIPALAWWRFGLNAIVAFWFAYVVTRPLGASFADYISKPQQT